MLKFGSRKKKTRTVFYVRSAESVNGGAKYKGAAKDGAEIAAKLRKKPNDP